MNKILVPVFIVAISPGALRAGDVPTSLDVDRSVDPCTDFYRFTCNNWIKNNPIPSDQPRWGRFSALHDRNLEILRGILEKASAPDPKRDGIDQRIGDFYASCMDEPKVDSLGASPVKANLDAVAALKSKAELPPLVAGLRSEGISVFAGFGSGADFKDPKTMIAQVDQGGLGLADRDLYLKEDDRSKEVRTKYLAHMEKMFALLGDSKETAAAQAKVVMELETSLAKASMDRTARRVPENRYHKMTTEELKILSPAFSWESYFKASGAPSFTSLNVVVPDYVKGLNAILEGTDLPGTKTYLRWHVLSEAAPLLSKPFVEENFDFYGKTMTGANELKPRWKRCVQQADDLLGEALGQRYIALTFGAQGKERMLKMVAALEQSLSKDIAELPWMTPTTKSQAAAKLALITNKIGYPERWRDYGSLKIERGNLMGDATRASIFETEYELGKIGKPTDKKEWGMTPPTVNAYYNPLHNDINFPAGILQPPFFDKSMDDPVNFGAIGAVIGHELTHGFDDSGRKFAGDGSLSDWWTPEDAKEFEKRAQCIVDQYGSYPVIGDLKLNGKLTLGENTADNGGLRIALMALGSAAKDGKPADGLTPEQRFFVGWGQIWCEAQHEELARLRVQVDPHSNSASRVNGTVSNMIEFEKAFGCNAGAPMVRENMCRVW